MILISVKENGMYCQYCERMFSDYSYVIYNNKFIEYHQGDVRFDLVLFSDTRFC